MLMCMVFSGGHASGGHCNPAVTFAVFLTGRDKSLHLVTMLGYWVSQIFGGVFAGLTGYGLTHDVGVIPSYKNQADGASCNSLCNGQAFGAEFLFTFALCYTVLNCAVSKSNIRDNSFFGLAIGFLVLSAAIAAGPISGAVFNPAVATGLFISNYLVGGTGYTSYWYIYYISEFLAAFAAALVFVVMHAQEYVDDDKAVLDSDLNTGLLSVEYK